MFFYVINTGTGNQIWKLQVSRLSAAGRSAAAGCWPACSCPSTQTLGVWPVSSPMPVWLSLLLQGRGFSSGEPRSARPCRALLQHVSARRRFSAVRTLCRHQHPLSQFGWALMISWPMPQRQTPSTNAANAKGSQLAANPQSGKTRKLGVHRAETGGSGKQHLK